MSRMKKIGLGVGAAATLMIVAGVGISYSENSSLNGCLSKLNSAFSVGLSDDQYNQLAVSTTAEIDNYLRVSSWRTSAQEKNKLKLIELDLSTVSTVWARKLNDGGCDYDYDNYIPADNNYCVQDIEQVYQLNGVPFPSDALLWSIMLDHTMTMTSDKITEFLEGNYKI